jgi:hypothetical protein
MFSATTVLEGFTMPEFDEQSAFDHNGALAMHLFNDPASGS